MAGVAWLPALRLWGTAPSLILIIAPVETGITLIADIVGTPKSREVSGRSN